MAGDEPMGPRKIVIGRITPTLDEAVAVARRQAVAVVSRDADYRAMLARGVEHLAAHVRSGRRVYGVTTGFGDSCQSDVSTAALHALATNLVRFHRCGTGACFSEEETRAIVLARLCSLARGYSAVRGELLDGLAALLTHDICPRIPSEGSVGASGDLTPLAYVAAALCGEGEVSWKGAVMPAADALSRAGITPLQLFPKESLAIMNGTGAALGLTLLGFTRARNLCRLAAALTSMAVGALRGEVGHFDDRIFLVKPHPGQRAFARWVREDVGARSATATDPARLQDRYSLRCSPHVVGVLLDSLPGIRSSLEIELGSVNDNPIVDPDDGTLLHSGNFYAGHVGHAADSLKACVASTADLLDRQLALLCNPVTSSGLPADLVAVTGPERSAHHGFKAMQITASALTAEALKLTMPASAFSRSTENHNQDKVSMGTIGARDLQRVLDLTETVAVIHLLALCAATELRGVATAGPRALALLAAVRESVPPNTGDRAMDADIASLLHRYRAGLLPIGEVDFG